MFEIELQIAEGVNFPYYVMGKAQLRILPFTDAWVWTDAHADPYSLFAQEYGAERREVEGAEELWYAWLSQTAARCPDDAERSQSYCQAPLLTVAQSHLVEYLERWPALRGKLAGRLQDGPSGADLAAILRRNEARFRLSYPAEGREIFHFNHFPTTATQKPGPHFIFGLGCLDLPKERLLGLIEHEVGNTLLQQITEDARVAFYRGRIEEVTRHDRYVRGWGSLIEALNWIICAIESDGDALTLDTVRKRRKPGEEGIWTITQGLFRQRDLWPAAGLINFVCASLETLP